MARWRTHAARLACPAAFVIVAPGGYSLSSLRFRYRKAVAPVLSAHTPSPRLHELAGSQIRGREERDVQRGFTPIRAPRNLGGGYGQSAPSNRTARPASRVQFARPPARRPATRRKPRPRAARRSRRRQDRAARIPDRQRLGL